MNQVKLANRIQTIPQSLTIAITNKAAELKAKNIDIVNLGAGEPDFDTPEFIKAAAIKAINNGKTKYTAVDGTLELKQAIVNKLKSENNLDYNLNQILVSVGAKHSLYNLTNILLDKDDEAIIPTPYWVSYPPMVKLADAKPIIVNTKSEDNLKLTAELLEKNITNKTKLLFLNSPSNPSGQIYTKQELLNLAKLLLKYPNIYIISDDIYEHIIWGDHKFYNILSACFDEINKSFTQEEYDNLYNRTIVINGVSKSYAMTGWRIGYAAGHPDLIKAMKKLQSQSTSNPCSIAQAAACEALINPDSKTAIANMVSQFKKRHDYIYEAINNIDLLSTLPAQGAFYSFIDCSKVIEKYSYKDDLELAEALLDQAHVALVAGSAFGCPNYLRLSYATSMENLELAIERIKNFLNK